MPAGCAYGVERRVSLPALLVVWGVSTEIASPLQAFFPSLQLVTETWITRGTWAFSAVFFGCFFPDFTAQPVIGKLRKDSETGQTGGRLSG
jgi:hypothetical protein